MQPYLALSLGAGASLAMIPLLDADEDAEDASIVDDIGGFSKLLHVLDKRKHVPDIALPHNADVIILTSGPLRLPAHQLILALRCPVLGNMVYNGCSLKLSGVEVSLISAGSISEIQIKGCHPLTVLIVLRYLYSDQLLAIWDFRIGNPFASQFETFDIKPTIVKVELDSLARVLDLQLLLTALQSPGKRVPTPSQAEDFRLLYEKPRSLGFHDEMHTKILLRPTLCSTLLIKSFIVIRWCCKPAVHSSPAFIGMVCGHPSVVTSRV